MFGVANSGITRFAGGPRPRAALDSSYAVIGTTLRRGDRMPKIVITHRVVDVDAWLKF
ncbi:MAG: hypothetical protein QOJ23_3043, partial [Actinomycetota bacterium]|nr:hypothetical protein [Actinomycetota bacterium]MDQ1567539.1 hypothetical protein [Actinomycetota bacterium]